MQILDDKMYKKYFSQRRENRKWAEKYKAQVEELEQQGIDRPWQRKNSRSQTQQTVGAILSPRRTESQERCSLNCRIVPYGGRFEDGLDYEDTACP